MDNVIQQFNIDGFLKNIPPSSEEEVILTLIAGFALAAAQRGDRALLPILTINEERKYRVVGIANKLLDSFCPTGNVWVNKTEDRFSIQIKV